MSPLGKYISDKYASAERSSAETGTDFSSRHVTPRPGAETQVNSATPCFARCTTCGWHERSDTCPTFTACSGIDRWEDDGGRPGPSRTD